MLLNLASWNINGIRSAVKKGFWQITSKLNLDILCLQEIKANPQVMHNLYTILDYTPYTLDFICATNRQGYSGVATFSLSKKHRNNTEEFSNTGLFQENYQIESNKIFTKNLVLTKSQIGLGIEKFDVEGRTVITFYQIKNQNIALINCYYPQGGRGQFRIDYKIEFYEAVLIQAKKLKSQGYAVILCGDFNTTVADIDLARPAENRNTTGCLSVERKALNSFFEAGFIDSFRYFYPDLPNKYTYWDQITRARSRNVGWRIDYFLVDSVLLPNLKQANIHDDIFGSDHCPVSIQLEFP